MRPRTILILAACSAFAAWTFYSLIHVEPVRVVESRLQHQNGRVFVEGKIENTGDRSGSVDLQVLYYDANGRKLGQDQIALDGLHPGAVISFRTSPQAIAEASSFSIY